jgi:hypothetical protein
MNRASLVLSWGACLALATGILWLGSPPRDNPGPGDSPIYFEPNRGQADRTVSYLGRSSGYAIHFAPSEVAWLSDRQSATPLRMRFPGASPATVLGEQRGSGKSHYYLGPARDRWFEGIPHYARVRYAAVYPGVDLVFYGNGQHLEFDFVVRPGADAGVMRMEFPGADVSLEADGNLTVTAGGERLQVRRPRVYQMADGTRRPVPARLVEHPGGEIGFELGEYDRTAALVIDPVLVFTVLPFAPESTGIQSSTLDAAGNLYVVGSGYDFLRVTKLSPLGEVLQTTKLSGGSGAGIALDRSGNVYVTGVSRDGFPTTPGAFQRAVGSAGLADAVVAKLAPDGTLLYATYLGGSRGEEGIAIAVDAFGQAVVAGLTLSLNFPLLNPVQASFRGTSCPNNAEFGCGDAFVAKLNAAGSGLVFSTYLGGARDERVAAVAVDAAGNVYLAGSTPSADFPATANAFQRTIRGDHDVYVAKFSPEGALGYATYLGGNSIQMAADLAVDGAGNAYVVGSTQATSFPTTPGVFQSSASNGDGFITKLNPSGSALVFSTLLGGRDSDGITAIALDSSGNVYVAGGTSSSDFPEVDRFQDRSSTFTPNSSLFLCQLDSRGSSLLLSTYFGSNETYPRRLAVDGSRNVYITGSTRSLYVLPAAAPLSSADYTAFFVAKLDLRRSARISSVLPSTVYLLEDTTLTVRGAGFRPGSVVRWHGADRQTTYVDETTLTAFLPGETLRDVSYPTVNVRLPPPDGGYTGVALVNVAIPTPELSALDPPSVAAGSPRLTLSLRGNRFLSTSVVGFGSVLKSPTVANRNLLQVTVFADEVASGATIPVRVFNETGGYRTREIASNTLTFIVSGNALPRVTELAPSRARVGSADLTIAVTGTGFVSTSVVRWNGNERRTRFVASTRLEATITAADLSREQTAQITVFTPPPGGGVSPPLGFVVETAAPNPLPALSGVQPSSIESGSAAFLLTVNGQDFSPNSTVRWQNQDRPTTFVSPVQLRATIPASDVLLAGTFSISVFSPPPGGGSSRSTAPFTVTVGKPRISALSPASAVTAGPAFTLIVQGANFIAGSTVRWNGVARATTFVNAAELRAAIPASDIASPGVAAITVYAPAPVDAVSGSFSLPVVGAAPAGRLLVYVADSKGNTLGGAAVSVDGGDPQSVSGVRAEATFTLPPGLHTVQIENSGYRAATLSATVTSRQVASVSVTLLAVDEGAPVTIHVPASAASVDTNIDVQSGQRLVLTASGVWGFGAAEADSAVGPEGRAGCRNAGALAPAVNCGALLARIGAGNWFNAGAAFGGPLPGGRLYLATNDSAASLSDNRGSLQVAVAAVSPESATCAAEPGLRMELLPGFYIAEVRNAFGSREGYWGMEVLAAQGALAGGFNLGGAMQEMQQSAAFGAFYLPGSQTVRIRVDAQVLPGADAAVFSMAVRLLDSKRQQIGSEQLGTAFVQFERSLAEGFYIIEINAAPASPRATFQVGLGADTFAAGVVVGGFLSPGLTGFGAFYIPEKQDVEVRVFGLPTYSGVGASCLRLTLLDAERRPVRSVP